MEEAEDLDSGWCQLYRACLCQDPVLPPPGSFRPGLPPWLPAQPKGMRNEPQLQLSILVPEWESENLAEGMVLVCIPTLSYPALSGDIKKLYVPHPSLEPTSASFSSSNSLDLSQPFVHP